MNDNPVCWHRAKNTFNSNLHFIERNPTTSFNPRSVYPKISRTAYVGPFSTVIGDVTIKNNVFIAPNVSIRADEGFPIYVDSHTNLQDGVILHGLVHGRVEGNTQPVSIYIGKGVSCAHGCIIHGPCGIGNSVFVGFKAVILDAIVGDGCFISINALITGGVRIPPGRFVPAGAIIDTQEKADNLRPVTPEEIKFAQGVQIVNNQLPRAYSKLYGKTKDSCKLYCSK